MKNEDIYKEASRKVKAKKRFLNHLFAYVCVMGMLYAIMQLAADGEMIPVILVGFSWGIGLASHYLSTFGTENLDILGVNPNWEEEELEQEIEKLKRKRELKERLQKEQDLLNDMESLELKEIEKRPLDEDLLS